MALSSGLTLADLSDYLAPSQLCIKPVTMVEDLSDPTPAEAVPKDKAGAITEIMIDEEHGYYEVSKGLVGKKLKKAEITLNDCLACSGCITSAESVLVSMQSHEEVYRVLEEQKELLPILSVSPQSLASLAALHDLSLPETLHGLRVFFKQHLGFNLVFDTTFARSISLSENRLEFLERRAYAQTSTPTSLATSALSPTSSPSGPLPILSSACPGWICYAEKTHGELLPFVSNVKSSQAVMGTLVKGGEVAKRLELRPDQIYHVTVMPCYDKKLEASRPDFATPFASESTTTPTVPDVDCVLTTGEVQKMLDDKDVSLPLLAQGYDGQPSAEDAFFPSLLAAPGSSSDGYLHNTIQAVLESLSPEDLYRTKLETRIVRSEDYVEYTLVASPLPSSTELALTTSSPALCAPLLRAAKCYGFRNLQNVVRKIGRDANVSVVRGAAGKLPSSASASAATARRNAALRRRKGLAEEVETPFDYVEVMACPSGCVNGGGQIAPPKGRVKVVRGVKGWKGERVDEEGMPDVVERMEVDEEEERVLSGKEWVARVEEVYWEVKETGLGRRELDWSRVDASIAPYVAREEDRRLVELRRQAVEGLLGGLEGDEREVRRRELLRTSYRAVESEETNGLAVRW